MNIKLVKIVAVSSTCFVLLVVTSLIPLFLKNRAIGICEENIASADKQYCSELVSYLPKIRKDTKLGYSLVSKNNLNRIFQNMWNMTTTDACLWYKMCYATEKDEILVNLNMIKSTQEKGRIITEIKKSEKEKQENFLKRFSAAKRNDLDMIANMQYFLPGYGADYKQKIKAHEQEVQMQLQESLEQVNIFTDRIRALGTPYEEINMNSLVLSDDESDVDLTLISTITNKIKSIGKDPVTDGVLDEADTNTVEGFFNGCGCINLDTEIIPQVKKECKQGDTDCYVKVEERLCRWN